MKDEETTRQHINEKSGSQDRPVSRFGVSSVDKLDKENISSRINESKIKNVTGKHLSNNAKSTNKKIMDDSKSLEKKDLNKKDGKHSLKNSAKNMLVNKALNDDGVVGKTTRTVKKTNKFIKVVKAMVRFLLSPFGVVLLFILGLFILIVFLVVIVDTIFSSFGLKFGITDSESYDTFNEKYVEGMSREQIEDIVGEVEGPTCEEGFFASVKHFFGFWDTEDPCELAHYVKHILEEKEDDTGITTISPGFFISALYYAYDTQNVNENGELYIKPKKYEKTDEDGNTEIVNDLDAITTLIDNDIYKNSDLENLLDMYILHTSGVYSYYKYEWEDEGTEDAHRVCNPYNNSEKWEVSTDKLKLYLRYGSTVALQYQEDKNIKLIYDKTDSQCKHMLSYEEPDLSIYDVKADYEGNLDDNAKIVINGITYGYDSGFIYQTYPKFDKRYIINGIETYNYKIDKVIEQFISYIESRQDYTNYVLGYPSSIDSMLANKGNTGAVCSYNLNGESVSDIKIRLLHARNNEAIPGVESYAPIEGQELINFDKYILGVTYAENGGAPEEAMKAQAIATASYVLGNAGENSRFKLVYENNQPIIEISSSTFHQTYCDPDKGCYICTSPSNSTIQTVLTDGTVPAQATCNYWKSPLSETSNIRTAVSAVAGMVLVDENGNVVPVGYVSETQNKWNDLARLGNDYVEILRNTYDKKYMISSPVCSFAATGNWASWRQFSDLWGNKKIGSKTMGQAGCLITANAMMLANSGKSLVIADFNPGTYLDLIKKAKALDGNNLKNEVAIEAALGNHNFEYNVETLLGSYENKARVIAEKLNSGYHVIISVKNDGHWIYVTGVNGSTIYMSDPASSKTIVTDAYNKDSIRTIKYIKFL